MLLVALCASAALAFLVLAGRYNESAAARAWEGALASESTEVYERIRESVEAQTLMVQMSYRTAARNEAVGAEGEAVHLLKLGVHSVEAGLPTLLHLNRGIRALSRHAGALGLVPPLRRSTFLSSRMRGIASMQSLVHHFVVTMRQRLVVRLVALNFGLRAVCGLLISSSEAAMEDPEAAGWGRMEALSADFGALGRESLETLRVVLASLRAGVLARPAGQPSSTR